MRFPKPAAVAALSLFVAPLARAAEERPLDKANRNLTEAQRSTKSGAKKLESDTNRGLEKARRNGRKAGKDAVDGLDDAAHKLRKKLGTE